MKAIRVFDTIRIAPVFFCGSGKHIGWRIEEIVDEQGRYIVWDGLFETSDHAIQEVEQELKIRANKDVDEDDIDRGR